MLVVELHLFALLRIETGHAEIRRDLCLGVLGAAVAIVTCRLRPN